MVISFDDLAGKPARVLGTGSLSPDVAACHRDRPWRGLGPLDGGGSGTSLSPP
jgi:hypothetical protein